MCFVTKGSKIRIATKDIVCYKMVIDKSQYCISCFQIFKYEYNKIYSGKSKWKLFSYWLFNLLVESEGYHSYVDDSEIPFFYKVKCIIPKYSLYLVNDRNTEYVSTSIIIKKYLNYE